MREVTPEVYVIAETRIGDGLWDYLNTIEQGEWKTDTEDDADVLTEFAGRLCYRSWEAHNSEKGPDATNPNVTRVREGNQGYITNLLKEMHGSVLEHANLSILFKNVSRVFTHELVRHRAGMAYSQESLRYVLLTDLGFWMPPGMPAFVEEAFRDVYRYVESVQMNLAEQLQMSGMQFKDKKLWTSRLRRLVPMGVATNILATGNMRAWRHIFTMRSNPGAEEEIRMVQDQLAPIFKDVAPSIFGDLEYKNDIWHFIGDPRRGV